MSEGNIDCKDLEDQHASLLLTNKKYFTMKVMIYFALAFVSYMFSNNIICKLGAVQFTFFTIASIYNLSGMLSHEPDVWCPR